MRTDSGTCVLCVCARARACVTHTRGLARPLVHALVTIQTQCRIFRDGGRKHGGSEAKEATQARDEEGPDRLLANRFSGRTRWGAELIYAYLLRSGKVDVDGVYLPTKSQRRLLFLTHMHSTCKCMHMHSTCKCMNLILSKMCAHCILTFIDF